MFAIEIDTQYPQAALEPCINVLRMITGLIAGGGEPELDEEGWVGLQEALRVVADTLREVHGHTDAALRRRPPNVKAT